jgi:hypothetical protein
MIPANIKLCTKLRLPTQISLVEVPRAGQYGARYECNVWHLSPFCKMLDNSCYVWTSPIQPRTHTNSACFISRIPAPIQMFTWMAYIFEFKSKNTYDIHLHSCPTHDSQFVCSECKLEIVHRYNHRICLINVPNSVQVTLRYVFGTHCSPMCVKATLSLTQLINVDKCHNAAKTVWYEVCRPSNTKNNHVPRRSAGRQGVAERSRWKQSQSKDTISSRSPYSGPTSRCPKWSELGSLFDGEHWERRVQSLQWQATYKEHNTHILLSAQIPSQQCPNVDVKRGLRNWSRWWNCWTQSGATKGPFWRKESLGWSKWTV